MRTRQLRQIEICACFPQANLVAGVQVIPDCKMVLDKSCLGVILTYNTSTTVHQEESTMNLQALLIRASVSIAAGLAMAAGVALNHSRPVEAFTATPAPTVKPHAAIVAQPVTLPTI